MFELPPRCRTIWLPRGSAVVALGLSALPSVLVLCVRAGASVCFAITTDGLLDPSRAGTDEPSTDAHYGVDPDCHATCLFPTAGADPAGPRPVDFRALAVAPPEVSAGPYRVDTVDTGQGNPGGIIDWATFALDDCCGGTTTYALGTDAAGRRYPSCLVVDGAAAKAGGCSTPGPGSPPSGPTWTTKEDVGLPMKHRFHLYAPCGAPIAGQVGISICGGQDTIWLSWCSAGTGPRYGDGTVSLVSSDPSVDSAPENKPQALQVDTFELSRVEPAGGVFPASDFACDHSPCCGGTCTDAGGVCGRMGYKPAGIGGAFGAIWDAIPEEHYVDVELSVGQVGPDGAVAVEVVDVLCLQQWKSDGDPLRRDIKLADCVHSYGLRASTPCLGGASSVTFSSDPSSEVLRAAFFYSNWAPPPTPFPPPPPPTPTMPPPADPPVSTKVRPPPPLQAAAPTPLPSNIAITDIPRLTLIPDADYPAGTPSIPDPFLMMALSFLSGDSGMAALPNILGLSHPCPLEQAADGLASSGVATTPWALETPEPGPEAERAARADPLSSLHQYVEPLGTLQTVPLHHSARNVFNTAVFLALFQATHLSAVLAAGALRRVRACGPASGYLAPASRPAWLTGPAPFPSLILVLLPNVLAPSVSFSVVFGLGRNGATAGEVLICVLGLIWIIAQAIAYTVFVCLRPRCPKHSVPVPYRAVDPTHLLTLPPTFPCLPHWVDTALAYLFPWVHWVDASAPAHKWALTARWGLLWAAYCGNRYWFGPMRMAIQCLCSGLMATVALGFACPGPGPNPFPSMVGMAAISLLISGVTGTLRPYRSAWRNALQCALQLLLCVYLALLAAVYRNPAADLTHRLALEAAARWALLLFNVGLWVFVALVLAQFAVHALRMRAIRSEVHGIRTKTQYEGELYGQGYMESREDEVTCTPSDRKAKSLDDLVARMHCGLRRLSSTASDILFGDNALCGPKAKGLCLPPPPDMRGMALDRPHHEPGDLACAQESADPASSSLRLFLDFLCIPPLTLHMRAGEGPDAQVLCNLPADETTGLEYNGGLLAAGLGASWLADISS
eukprot:gene11815-325_t